MTETTEPSVYEKVFAKSNSTDAILVVDGRKLHVNKALLSYHSDYFNVLFNSDFKEKTMEEIEIKDVRFKNFAMVLSLVHGAPIRSSKKQESLEALCQIADQFQLPAAMRHLELYLMTGVVEPMAFVSIADKYQLNDLMDFIIPQCPTKLCFCSRGYDEKLAPNRNLLDGLSKETKVKIFNRTLEIDKLISVTPKVEDPLIYEKAFAKSDKTDAILLVDEKKLHVNKALLSYHSDYFNTLLNPEFQNEPMQEFEIKDVKFEDFATVLSQIQTYPIAPKKESVENLLELADRFSIPCVKFILRPLIFSLRLDVIECIRIGDKYGMADLMKHGVEYMKEDYYKDLISQPFFKGLSDDTKIELLYNYLTF